jgi:hypothetical protein
MSDIQRVVQSDPSVENPQAVPTRIPGRGGSRVTVGYFDREGVDQLRQTLTRLSEHQDPAQNVSSETLSVPVTGPFDFEKTLRTIMKKCAVVFVTPPSITNSGLSGVTVQVFNRANSVSCSKIFMLLDWALLPVFSRLLARSSTPRPLWRTSKQCVTHLCVTF